MVLQNMAENGHLYSADQLQHPFHIGNQIFGALQIYASGGGTLPNDDTGLLRRYVFFFNSADVMNGLLEEVQLEFNPLFTCGAVTISIVEWVDRFGRDVYQVRTI